MWRWTSTVSSPRHMLAGNAAPGELARLQRRGKLERVEHGVYRFPELPETARDEYMLATLWPNVTETALSHDTALTVYELCDINPDHGPRGACRPAEPHLVVEQRFGRIQRSCVFAPLGPGQRLDFFGIEAIVDGRAG